MGWLCHMIDTDDLTQQEPRLNELNHADRERLVRETGVRMIQWRNLNVDPDLYADVLGRDSSSPRLGMPALLERVRTALPALRFGYFNPPAEEWK